MLSTARGADEARFSRPFVGASAWPRGPHRLHHPAAFGVRQGRCGQPSGKPVGQHTTYCMNGDRVGPEVEPTYPQLRWLRAPFQSFTCAKYDEMRRFSTDYPQVFPGLLHSSRDMQQSISVIVTRFADGPRCGGTRECRANEKRRRIVRPDGAFTLPFGIS